MPAPRPSLGDEPSLDDDSFDALDTEAGGAASADYELRSTLELVELMVAGQAAVSTAVQEAVAAIASTVDEIADRLRRGGRLIYVGAGSSGRLAALDAAECAGTFSAAPGTVVALVAGESAPPLEQATAEDDRAAGATELARLAPGPDDAVVAVSASGRTPYVLGAIETAAALGSFTACVVSVHGSELEHMADQAIRVVVGPEFLAGSTRLKAGTAQKLVLDMLSTLSMIRLGKTYGNLMVDVAATNEKLRRRVRRIVRTATGASPDEVEDALDAAGGTAKVAIVSLLAGVDVGEARARLERSDQSVRRALDG